MNPKKHIAVLFGGCSPEHEVSLQSAHAVLSAMDRERFDVLPLGIDPEGAWFLYRGDRRRIPDGSWRRDKAHLERAMISPDRKSPGLLVFSPEDAERVRCRIALDAAFPVLHGQNGEDGTVQGLLELSGIPIVGCGTLASALCMDKLRSHRLVEAAGIPVPRSAVWTRAAGVSPAQAAASLPFPLFVKPVRAGSSFGISKISGPADLDGAVAAALAYDDTVILEESIEGFEVGCAVLGREELFVGRADEIELSDGFFDFTEKYTLKSSRIHVPARLSREDEARVQETAKTIYRVLGCAGFARVDMFFTPNGRIVFNEVNTIPGFTAHSRFPRMLQAAGLSLEEVVARAIETAVGP